MSEKTPHSCHACDSEFFVFPTYDNDELDVSFCPYCGSELELSIEDLDDEDDDE